MPTSIGDMTMGDVFKNISGSTIINRPRIEGALSVLQQNNKADSVEALNKLVEFVEQSGNKEAGELTEELTQELAKPKPRKSLISTIWRGIQALLPDVSKILEITDGIAKLAS